MISMSRFYNGEKKLLDVEEYEQHKEKMHYSDDIDFILKENVKVLVDWINQNKGPFLRNISKFGITVMLNCEINKVEKSESSFFRT